MSTIRGIGSGLAAFAVLVALALAAPATARGEDGDPPSEPAFEGPADDGAIFGGPEDLGPPPGGAVPTAPLRAAPRPVRRASAFDCGKPRCGCLRVTAEGGIAWIDDPEGQLGTPLPVGVAGPPFDFGLNEYGTAFAARATVEWWRNDCDRVELRGTWFGSWDDSSRQTGQFAFDNQPGVSPLATATLESEADLWTVELNGWRALGQCGPWCWSAGVGLRYLRFDETATARDWIGLANPASFLEAEAQNELIAAQLGASLRYAPHACLAFEGVAKAFGGYIARDVDVYEDSILSGGVKTAADGDDGFGWGFEVGLSARWQLSPRWAVVGGYTLLYVDEVARAAEGFDFSQGFTGAVQATQSTDSLFAHAVFLGISVDL